MTFHGYFSCRLQLCASCSGGYNYQGRHEENVKSTMQNISASLVCTAGKNLQHVNIPSHITSGSKLVWAVTKIPESKEIKIDSQGIQGLLSKGFLRQRSDPNPPPSFLFSCQKAWLKNLKLLPDMREVAWSQTLQQKCCLNTEVTLIPDQFWRCWGISRHCVC